MKSDVGIGVEPMPAGRVTTVHDRDGRIRMPEERVGECHPGGPGADDEIVGVEIKAKPEKIWDAITKPEWTARYGYQGPAE